MHEAGEDRGKAVDSSDESSEATTRPQKAGEGGTTRFGMEDGDNTDVPATGDGTREE